MKSNLITQIVAGTAVLTSILPISSSVQASSDKYSCQEVNSVYGVYSSTPRGKMNLLNFTRDVSQDWSIDERCAEVATRFQRYYDNGTLRFIGSGTVNQQPVLCAVLKKGEACSNDNLLVTLPPDQDPIESARKLMDTRGLASGRVISVNGKSGKLESYVDGNAYYDIEILEQLILENENSDRLIPNE